MTRALQLAQLALIAAVVLMLPGCQVIGTIFEAGMWVGILGILVIVGIIGFIASRMRR